MSRHSAYFLESIVFYIQVLEIFGMLGLGSGYVPSSYTRNKDGTQE
jgi:hypothetical protein